MTQTSTTTTTTTTTSTQTGTQLTVSSQSNTYSLGNQITNVSVNPYIPNIIISFYAYNMRPNQLLHVFFDNVNVDQYCAPGTRTSSNTYVINITNTSDYNQIQKNGNWGTAIYSDNNGYVAGQFNIPAGTFKQGDRTLEIADVSSLTLGASSITTMASATFTSSVLSVTQQSVTLTTVNPVLNFIPVTNTVTSTTVNTTSTTLPPVNNNYTQFAPQNCVNMTRGWNGGGAGGAWDPLAQSFTITTPSGEAGIFATSLDIFFNQTSLTANNGVSVYICDTNNGYPDGNSILPFSTTHLPMSSVNIDPKASVATNFKFESPVFLENNKLYAFIVKPDNNDPDYQVWMANLGNIDVTTNNQVFSQPAVGGTAFYGATGAQWTALQTEYVKFNLNVAQFTQAYGDAYFINTPTDILTPYNIGYSSTSVGILPGDIVFQSTNSLPSTACTTIYGIIKYYDPAKGYIYAGNTTGNFSNNSYIQVHRFTNTSLYTSPNTTTLIAFANTANLHNVIVDSLVGQFATIEPAGTSLYFEYFGTSNTFQQDSNANPITVGGTSSFTDQERIVASRSVENTNLSGNSSMTIHSHLTTTSPYLSPIIDTVKNKQLVIQNLVSPVTFPYSEFYNSGYQNSKYISEIVTLAPGQDSEDLQIIISGYRPTGTDIKVFARYLNSYDTNPISNKTWTPMINTSQSLYSSTSNPTDFKEYIFTNVNTVPNTIPGYVSILGSTGNVTASNTSNTITGLGTYFTSNLSIGVWLNMPANSSFIETPRQVVNIISDTQLQLNAPWNGNYTNQPFNIVAPPTTAYVSSNTLTQVMGLANTSTTNNAVVGYSSSFSANTTGVNGSSGILITGANTYYTANQQIYYYVPSGNTAVPGLTGNSFYYVAAASTTSITLANTIGGSAIPLTPSGSSTETHYIQSTAFLTQFQPGNIITIGGQPQTVVSVANNTYLTVGSPYVTASVNANVYSQTNQGLTYLNSANALFNTFIQFQIKVILQSNSSALVPTMDSLQALALQM